MQEVNRYIETKDSGKAESKGDDPDHTSEELEDHSKYVSRPRSSFSCSFWSSLPLCFIGLLYNSALLATLAQAII